MTRKHFKVIAEELARGRPGLQGIKVIQWRRDCVAVAGACSRCNPQFKQYIFLEACGYYE